MPVGIFEQTNGERGMKLQESRGSSGQRSILRPCFLYIAIECRAGDPKRRTNFLNRMTLVGIHVLGKQDFVGCQELLWSTTLTPSCPCNSQARVGACATQIMIKFGKKPYQVKRPLAIGHRGIDLLGQTDKVNTPLFEDVERFDKVFQGIAETVEFPHDQCISRTSKQQRFL